MPQPLEPQPFSDRRHRRGRPARVHVRNASTAFASAGVIALLVLYAVAAPTAGLSASVGPVVPHPGSTALVQGRVLKSDGGALGGAHIVVHQRGRLAGAAVSTRSGTFRVALSGGCARYDIVVRARTLGTTVETSTQRRLCPGDALPFDARVVTQGHFLWVPGPR